MSLKPRVLPKTWRQEQAAVLRTEEQLMDDWAEQTDRWPYLGSCYECGGHGCYWCTFRCDYDKHVWEGLYPNGNSVSRCTRCLMPKDRLPDPLEMLAREAQPRFGVTFQAIWPA